MSHSSNNRLPGERAWRFQFTLKALLGAVAICAVLLSVLTWRIQRPYREGRAFADRLWRERSAVIYSFNLLPHWYVDRGYHFERYYDRQTGLRVAEISHRETRTFYKAYNQRIRELLDKHGIPSWSAKEDIPDDNHMVAMLDDPDMHNLTIPP